MSFRANFLVAVAFLLNLVMAEGESTYVKGPNVADPGQLTRRQAAIWLPIILVLGVCGAVYALYTIDDVKNRDTILYAKFIANLKEKHL